MTTVEQLRAAKALIDTPEKLEAGIGGARKGGRALNGIVQGILSTETADFFYRFLPENEGFADFGKRPHADIMALFDRAIADAEQSEAQDA